MALSHQATRADVLFGVRGMVFPRVFRGIDSFLAFLKGRAIVIPGHHGKPFPHLCPGDGCAIARWLSR